MSEIIAKLIERGIERKICINYANMDIQTNMHADLAANTEECIVYKRSEIMDVTEQITIFKNGYQTQYQNKTITTYNTCAFDSIFAIYTCIYFDNPNFREHLDISNFLVHSKFTALVYTYFDSFSSSVKSTSRSTSNLASNPKLTWNKLYHDRNIILRDIYSNTFFKKSSNLTSIGDTTYINCKTGLGGFYAQLCLEMSEIMASSIERKICVNCKEIKGKILPFIKVDVANLDLKNLEKSIDLKCSKDRLCINCKEKCLLDRVFNNLLALEVEPDCDIQYQKKILLRDVTETINIGKIFKLHGVIEFDPVLGHFTSHVKRKNNEWKIYDDLKLVEMHSDETKHILPYMLFYVAADFDSNFKSNLQEKNRKISTIECDEIRNSIGSSKTLLKISTGSKEVIEEIKKENNAKNSSKKQSIQTNSLVDSSNAT